MNATSIAGVTVAGLLTIAMFATAGWDLPPVDAEQNGFRGVGLQTVIDREDAAASLADPVNQLPPVPWEPFTDGDRAGDIYENVQVLGDLSDDQFTQFMQSITEWVSPEQGCNYCHNPANLASDEVYTKHVSRRMIQMTQHINDRWAAHVGGQDGEGAYVNCWTCHRGENVPLNVWFENDQSEEPKPGMLAYTGGQNLVNADLTSLPGGYLEAFLQGNRDARVHSDMSGPSGNTATIQDTEWTYAFMIHQSNALGVNCTYCHNSRAFNSWDESPPQRVTAWHGIRMVRDVNTTYINPLTPMNPDYRIGAQGDIAKVNCTTCHQGVNQPLYGAYTLETYEYLQNGDPTYPNYALPAGPYRTPDEIAEEYGLN